VNFDDMTNPLLNTDDDIVGEIKGKDDMGCGLEKGKSCFDKLVSYIQREATSTTAATGSSTPAQ
jgi:hypothetical protein